MKRVINAAYTVAFLVIGLFILFVIVFSWYSKHKDTETFNTIGSYYEENSINPYMGFAPPAEGGPYLQPHSLVYANFTWRELEPQKGEYAFEAIEKKYQLDDWHSQDVKLIFRVVLDYPGQTPHLDIPDWLYQETGEDGTWYTHEWGSGFSPNYENEILIAYHQQLIQALADRYDNHPAIAFIELGSIGHWGEWHTLQQDGIYIPFPSLTTTKRYAWHYTNHFNEKILLMGRPHPSAINHRMGLYNDMFGKEDETVDEFWNWVEHGYTFWLTGEQHPSMRFYWKERPTGGEFAPTSNWGDYFSDQHFSGVIDQLNLTHVSWLGPSAPADYPVTGSYQGNIEQLLHTIGYHFRAETVNLPATVQLGKRFTLKMDWINSGVAPFYYNWPLEISLVDHDGIMVHKDEWDGDIRNWTPGKHRLKKKLELPSAIPPGKYIVQVAIVDPSTGRAGIQLDMPGRQGDNRYKIGEIVVE